MNIETISEKPNTPVINVVIMHLIQNKLMILRYITTVIIHTNIMLEIKYRNVALFSCILNFIGNKRHVVK